MPFEIVRKIPLNTATCRMEIRAPQIAKKAQAGQFLIFIINEKGERVPLTVYETDPEKGLISIIFQGVGTTTKKLCLQKQGGFLQNILGPLGKPTDFGKVGTVCIVAGGVGIAEAFPIAKYAKAHGNRVLGIIGARTRKLLILEDAMNSVLDELTVTTDDGSHGLKGLVTAPLEELIKKKRVDLVYCVGPDIMMKAVCGVTKLHNVKTIVSLDANMVDATGICGTCRVTVGGETKFACVHGPEFDGHAVDWDEFMKRQKRFAEEEARSLDAFTKEKACACNG